MQQGFIDLRQNDGRLVDDSFWPSFTDVMTVIVMIFLIATTVLIVKNWELVKQLEQRILSEKEISAALKVTIFDKNKTHQDLLESLAAKEQISRELDASIEALQKTNALAEKNQAENTTLEERLTQSQSTLELLKLQLLQTKKQLFLSQDEVKNKTQSLEQKLSQITELDKQLKESLGAIKTKTQSIESHIIDLNRLADLLDKSRTKTTTMQQQLDNSKSDIQQLKHQLDKTQHISITQQQQIEKDQTLIKNKEVKYKELMARLVEIEIKLKDQEILFSQAKDTINIKQQLIADKEQLIADKEQKILNLNSLSKSQIIALDKQTKLYQQQTKQLYDLNQTNLNKQAQLEELNNQIILAQKLQENQGKKYDELEEKYKKLIRPSRSALGKYVVEVRYEKENDQDKILYKDATESNFTELSLEQLNVKLAKLKQQYGQRLYVKVIIPDESGLSYKEAWDFMQDIFNKYDYYYQLNE